MLAQRRRPAAYYGMLSLTVAFVLLLATTAWSQNQTKDRTFTAVVTDVQGVESEIKNVLFYWEEKVSETAFVPHELRDIPVKKGAATIKIKFDQIRQVDIKPTSQTASPAVVVSLINGKTGEFTLAINGKFKGISDFGETEFPATGLMKIVFK